MKKATREALKRIAENDPSFDDKEYVCPSLSLFLLTLPFTLPFTLFSKAQCGSKE